jgi:hypothetical protein
MTQHTRHRDSSDDREGPLWAAASVPLGAAVDPELIDRDARYARTLGREFNAITPPLRETTEKGLYVSYALTFVIALMERQRRADVFGEAPAALLDGGEGRRP